MKKILLIAFAAVLLVAFCAPAMAATKKVSFYGDVRFNTYWVHKDKDYYAVRGNTTGDTDNDLLWELDNADSRFGARFSEGPISANVEIRPKQGLYYRQWWGAWNLGWGTLLVGHTYVPLCLAIGQSQFDSESLVVYGSYMDRLRDEQIQLTIPYSMGYFKVALVKPPTTLPDVTGGSLSPNVDVDTKIPEIEACLNINFSPVSIDLVGAYHTIDFVNATNDKKYDSVDSYIFGGRVQFNAGPFYVKGLAIFGQNVGNAGELSSSTLKYRNMLYDVNNDRSEDSDYTDYGGVIGYKINDMITAEVGWFYQKTERYKKEKDANGAYYIVFPITPIKGVTIYPEIGVFDDKDFKDAAGNSTDQGKRTYFGMYWKISF